jgi:geranylgeranyl pyrophosphate synthase
VDESLERRGFFSINAIWKNKIAVLVGDYLLSKGLLLSTTNNDFEHLHILSDAVQQMSEGELLQIEKSRKLNLKEIFILRSFGVKQLLYCLLPAPLEHIVPPRMQPLQPK